MSGDNDDFTKKGHVSVPVLLKLDKLLSSSSHVSYIYFFPVSLGLFNQNAEISELRSSTLETFGWLEEARSREGTAEDCKYLQLLRARPLDPRSQRQLASLRAQFLYCEQQVCPAVTIGSELTSGNQLQLNRDDSQVEGGSRKLDLQWEAHTARLKRAVGQDMSDTNIIICGRLSYICDTLGEGTSCPGGGETR